jgi:hypothetical protein
MKTWTRPIIRTDDALRWMTAALEQEWTVSFEYLIHAYSMPKGEYFYREHIFTQERLLENARSIPGLT